MALNRLIAPGKLASPIAVFNATYQQVPGTVVDVPNGHVATLVQAGWSYIALSGSTAQRPVQGVALAGVDGMTPGLEYFDSTLGKCIFADSGLVWRDPATGAAV